MRLENIGFQHMVREQPRYQVHKKNEVNVDVYLTPHTKINTEWIVDIKTNLETVRNQEAMFL